MEGDGDDEVDVLEVWDGDKAAAEESAEVAADGQVGMVLQGARDFPVGPFVIQ